MVPIYTTIGVGKDNEGLMAWSKKRREVQNNLKFGKLTEQEEYTGKNAGFDPRDHKSPTSLGGAHSFTSDLKIQTRLR